MAFCAHCGRGLLADSQFCTSCGTTAVAVNTATPSASAGPVVTPPTSWSPAGAPPVAPPSFAPSTWNPPASGPSAQPINRALAVWLQIVLGCTAALFVIAAFAVVSVRAAARSYYGSNGVTTFATAHTWASREDTANALLGFAGLASIAVAVLMIIWAYQFTRAVNRHGPHGRKWSPSWAIGGWFIPIANYFVCPAILMEDEKIAAAAARGNTEGWAAERPNPLTVFWFGAWALGGILSFVGNRAVHATTRLSLPSEHQLMAGYLVLVVGLLASASALTMAAMSVRRMTRLDHGEGAAVAPPVAVAPGASSFGAGPNWDL